MSLASFLAKKCIEFASVGSENAIAAGCTSFNANDLKKKRKIKKSKTKTKLKCNRNQPPKTFAAIRRPSQVMQQPAKATAAGAGTVAILKSLASNHLPPSLPTHTYVYRFWDSLTALHLALCFAWPAARAANCFSYRFLRLLFTMVYFLWSNRSH